MSDGLQVFVTRRVASIYNPKGYKYYYFFMVYIVMMNNYYRTDRVPIADARINAV